MNISTKENIKSYQKIIKLNRAIEENMYISKKIITIYKIMLYFPLNLKKIRKDKRGEFIIDLLKYLEYDARKKCGYILSENQVMHCFCMEMMIRCLEYDRLPKNNGGKNGERK